MKKNIWPTLEFLAQVICAAFVFFVFFQLGKLQTLSFFLVVNNPKH